MEPEIRFSNKRFIYILAMFAVAIATDFALSIFNKADTYDVINLIAVTFVLMILGIVWLEYDRATHKYAEEKYSNFGRIFLIFAISCVLVFICFLFKLVIVPFSVISLMFSLITGPTTGIIFGTYFCVIYFNVFTIDYRYFILYLVLTVMGAAIARLFADRDTLIGGSVIMLCSYVLSICAVTFATEQSLSVFAVVYSMAYGIVAIVISIVFGRFVASNIDNRQAVIISRMLEEDSKARQAVKYFSPQIYDYCTKVAELSYEAAGYIGADANLAYAGGLFSKIGLIAGESLEKNNLRLAQHYNFPNNLAQVVHEAGNEKKSPATKEGAIVIMASKCMKAFEQLGKDKSKSGLNKDIVIQQIFNTASGDYFFDECGLTMREYLCVKDSFSRKIHEL